MVLWFFSIFSERSQAVLGSGSGLSDWLPVHSGVPQSSVLRLLLFSLFVNDLPTVLVHSKHVFYADDLQIYLHCPPSELPEAVEHLSADVRSVGDWISCNKSTLNFQKTKAMCMGSGRFVRQLVTISSLRRLDRSTVGSSFGVSRHIKHQKQA